MPERNEIRAINQTMVQRLLAAPPQPLPEGGYALRVVRARGRRSATETAVPLGVVRVAGQDHLVSPNRERDWVRNLLADGHCAVLPATDADPAERRAVLAEPDAAVRVVAAYLAGMDVPWALRAFPVAKDASPAEIREHLDTMAVFRLDPLSANGSAGDSR